LYTKNLVRTTFIPKEIFYFIIFKQATGFLNQLNEVKPLFQFFSNVLFSQHNWDICLSFGGTRIGTKNYKYIWNRHIFK
jgi:hypothetical protein